MFFATFASASASLMDSGRVAFEQHQAMAAQKRAAERLSAESWDRYRELMAGSRAFREKVYPDPKGGK